MFHRRGGHNCNCISLFSSEDLIFIVLYGNGILLQLDQIRGLLQLQQDCAREREEGGGDGKRRRNQESSRQESKAKQEEAALSTVASLSGRRRLQEGSSGDFVSNWREISIFWRF